MDDLAVLHQLEKTFFFSNCSGSKDVMGNVSHNWSVWKINPAYAAEHQHGESERAGPVQESC